MEFRIRGTPSHLFVEGDDISQAAVLNAHGFFSQLLQLPTRRCLDLLRIAAGVHVVDRIVKRPRRDEDAEGRRRLHLILDVKEPDFWATHDVRELLLEILTFLTDDDWSLAFQSPQRPSDQAHQDFLDLPRHSPTHAALFSGGIDSLAGLANRLLECPKTYILTTVGHQSHMHARVTRQLSSLDPIIDASHRANRQIGVTSLLHSTLTTGLERGKAKRMKYQERTQRSRAFLFCAAGAVAADAYKLRAVEMFENGVGSINLPLMTGMLGNSLSTRGAHPTFINLMSQLLSRMIQSSFSFVLPFEGQTKGEMLRRLSNVEGAADWLQRSHSCVHSAIRVAGKTHCGVCPACIERRQAFSVAGIGDDSDQYISDVFSSDVFRDEPTGDAADYFNLYKFDALRCSQGADSYLRRMRSHLRMTAIPPSRDEAIRRLLLKHSTEVLATFKDLQ